MNNSAASVPTATVVIPCWNASKWIKRAICSVLDQSIEGVEVIVVDDGSIDESVEVARAFEPRITVLTGPNRGAPAARNRGLAQARADYVMFLDADDYIDRASLEYLLRQITDADLVLGPWVWERDGFRELAVGPTPPLNAVSLLSDWWEGRFTPPCAVLWRRSFIQAIGAWEENLRLSQDCELIVRALLKGARVATTNNGLGVYVQHDTPGRVSQRRGREALESELRAFGRLTELLPLTDQQLRTALGKFFYTIAGRAYVAGFDRLGRQALEQARRLGFKGHRGSLAHLLVAGVLGLETKMVVARLLWRLRQKNRRN